VNFVVVKPETAGYPVSFPPITCRFDTWLVQTLLGFCMREATMYQYRPQPGAPPRTVEKRRRLSRGGE
jgi:hypothetical protein